MDSQRKDQILSYLNDLIFNDKHNVTCNFISKKFQIHISEAIKILEQFVAKHKNDKISTNYLLNGFDNSENSIVKLRRFLIVDENELESSKSSFDNVTCHVYSVSPKNDERDSTQFLNFDKFIFEPSSENFNKVQSLTYLKNPEINVRPLRRSCASTYIDYDLFDEENSQKVKEELKSTNEPMDIDLKEVSQNKRQISKGSDYSDKKKYKRIKTFDDSDDDDENKMKENVKSEPNDKEEKFSVTKVENSSTEKPKIKSVKDEKPIKPKQHNNNGPMKVKLQTQTSITSFFKKPSK